MLYYGVLGSWGARKTASREAGTTECQMTSIRKALTIVGEVADTTATVLIVAGIGLICIVPYLLDLLPGGEY